MRRTSLLVVMALMVMVLVVGAACGSGSDRAASTSTTEPPAASSTSPPSTITPATSTAAPTATSTSTTTTVPRPPVGFGDEGDLVWTVQHRLGELGYWLGVPGGIFGAKTEHAVIALQKTAELEPDGVVDTATWAALDAGIRPTARSTDGRVVEIDLRTQVLSIVTDGAVEVVLDTSTGRVTGTTPVGTWTTYREIDGNRYAPLGLLYRPKYFYGGVAIHGYTSVPAEPASHGCVRLTYPAVDMIWEEGHVPLGTTVLVYDG